MCACMDVCAPVCYVHVYASACMCACYACTCANVCACGAPTLASLPSTASDDRTAAEAVRSIVRSFN